MTFFIQYNSYNFCSELVLYFDIWMLNMASTRLPNRPTYMQNIIHSHILKFSTKPVNKVSNLGLYTFLLVKHNNTGGSNSDD